MPWFLYVYDSSASPRRKCATLRAAIPPCAMATGATSGAPGAVAAAAESPVTKTSGWPSSCSAELTTARPTRSCGPGKFSTNAFTRTPAVHTIVAERIISPLLISTKSSPQSVTFADVRTSMPRALSRRSACAFSRGEMPHRMSGVASSTISCTSPGRIPRYSRATYCEKKSLNSVISSTPV